MQHSKMKNNGTSYKKRDFEEIVDLNGHVQWKPYIMSCFHFLEYHFVFCVQLHVSSH